MTARAAPALHVCGGISKTSSTPSKRDGVFVTPLQPRYAKQVAGEDSLMAVIVARAMNHGNLLMSRTSDIPYHVLEATCQQYLRLVTLQAANDGISNATAELPIFEHYRSTWRRRTAGFCRLTCKQLLAYNPHASKCLPVHRQRSSSGG